MRRLCLLIGAWALCAAVIPFGAAAEPSPAHVDEVIDGDTLRVNVEKGPLTVRLLGIDCPELDQAHGPEAKQYVVDRVLGQDVLIESPESNSDQRFSGLPDAIDVHAGAGEPGLRAIVLTFGDGQVLNTELLAAGMAWFYEADTAPARDYRRAVATAIRGREGLWAAPAPLAMSDFRGQGQPGVHNAPAAAHGVGHLIEPDTPFTAELLSVDGPINVTSANGEPVELPAGRYQIRRYTIQRFDSSRVPWTMTGRFRLPVSFHITAGRQTRLPVGPPVTVGFRVAKKKVGEVSFNLLALGRGGEPYTLDSIKRRGATLTPPRIAITDPAGDQVVNSAFRYG